MERQALMKYPPPRGMMIDLDDTILANEMHKGRCWEEIRSEYSCYGRIDEAISAINKTTGWFWSDPERHRKWRQDLRGARRHIFSLAFAKYNLPNNGVALAIADRFTELLNNYMKPFPGAIDALKLFREKGVKLSLVTNGSSLSQREKINRFDLSGLFDYIFIEGEHGVGKPDSRVYLYTLERISVRPSEAWMIGDKFEWEVSAPSKLGIRGIWVNTRNERVNGADVKPLMTLNSLAEIPERIKWM